MAQIGNHAYEDSTSPLPMGTSAVGDHGFADTDNRDTPCNGLSSCSQEDTDND